MEIIGLVRRWWHVYDALPRADGRAVCSRRHTPAAARRLRSERFASWKMATLAHVLNTDYETENQNWHPWWLIKNKHVLTLLLLVREKEAKLPSLHSFWQQSMSLLHACCSTTNFICVRTSSYLFQRHGLIRCKNYTVLYRIRKIYNYKNKICLCKCQMRRCPWKKKWKRIYPRPQTNYLGLINDIAIPYKWLCPFLNWIHWFWLTQIFLAILESCNVRLWPIHI